MLVQQVDQEKIKTAVKLHAPIEIITYTLPHNKELYILEVLTVFLKECRQEHMTEYLKFCMSELLINAKKANTKRIYFKEKNLDLNNTQDYNKGMETCKEDTMNNINYYLQKQKDAGLYIKVVLQFTDDYIKLEIRNNSVLCNEEKKRIQEKLNKVKQYNELKDVFSKVIDQTEGAGLGIIIIILMLQKIGLSKENYVVKSTDLETITSIILPLNKNLQSGLNLVYKSLLDQQIKIPIIKENINHINTLLNKENVNYEELSDFISKDITLSTLLLKNTSRIQKNNCKISKAIEILGKDGIKELFGSQNKDIYFINKKDDTREMWLHSYKVAFYVYNLAKNFKFEEEYDLEELYIIALLHDIECVLLELTTQQQKESICSVCKNICSSEDVLQLLENDFGHGKSGCVLVQKWGIPAKIANVIKYHNNPDLAPAEYKKVIYLVYLADIMQYFDSNTIEFYQINENVRKEFNLDSEEKLQFINKQIKSIMV